jgi:hypothetical protein
MLKHPWLTTKTPENYNMYLSIYLGAKKSTRRSRPKDMTCKFKRMRFISMKVRMKMAKFKIILGLRNSLMMSSLDMRRWEIFDTLTVVLWI